MNQTPNALQRLIVRLYMLPAFTRLWPRVQHPIDAALLKLTGGRVSMTQSLSGVAVIELTTTGAKSGLARSMPLVGIFDGERLALIASNFGQEHNPAWYHNIAAHPDDVRVVVDGVETAVTAEQLHDDARARAWAQICAAQPRFAKYAEKTDRVIPIIKLTPR